ncbi:MAG: hypothetical protein LUC93_03290 [Planctomycetaceae bacterium]|nr:hypothetical protein [Planctomycetaceae bacterium]
MGVPAALIGGALLGTLLGGKGNSGGYDTSFNSGGINYQSPAAAIPEAPEAPANDDGSKSDSVLAAEEDERKRRAAEQEANRTNFTSGLGLTSSANINRKSLLG